MRTRPDVGKVVAASAVMVFGILASHGCGQDDSAGGDGGSNAAGAAGTGAAGGGTGGTGIVIDSGSGGDGQHMDPDAACAATTVQAKQVPVDMYFVLDTSGSMIYDGKIAALQVGIFKFLGDPASAGLGAAAQKFPLPVASDPEDESCEAAKYETPDLPWVTLPSEPLRDWVLALKAGGFTPTIPALQGAVDACRARFTSQGGKNKCVVVMVTDGKPEGQCVPTDAEAQAPLGTLAAEAFADGIPVFAIGFPGLPALGQSILETIATNGGTKTPILIQSGDVGTEFVQALNSIRGASLGCEFQMPVADGGTVNPGLVNVDYTSGSLPSETLDQKTQLSDCGTKDGWYYDNDTNPTRITLCPATCDRVRNDAAGRIDILLGCSTHQR